MNIIMDILNSFIGSISFNGTSSSINLPRVFSHGCFAKVSRLRFLLILLHSKIYKALQ